MRNIRLEIEYDGTGYCGWQIQNSRQSIVYSPEKKTIQHTIENVLQKILQEKIRLIGSGRTDAGVHAKAQVANFTTPSEVELHKLQAALNALLPEDISIRKIKEVSDDFHSRFSAQSKIYRYTILNSAHRGVLLRNYVFFCRYPLDIKRMQREAGVLLGTHDFSAFCSSAGKYRNPKKTIKKLKIIKYNDLLYIEIEADGFLYNMVRNIAGTLIEIGRGRFPPESMKSILDSRNRKCAGPTLPAKGLCLIKVKYK